MSSPPPLRFFEHEMLDEEEVDFEEIEFHGIIRSQVVRSSPWPFGSFKFRFACFCSFFFTQSASPLSDILRPERIRMSCMQEMKTSLFIG